MTTKLTLTLNKEVIDRTKDFAATQGTSLSELVENYFKMLTHKDQNAELSPITKKLKGAVKISADFDYQQILEDELAKKYLG